MASGLDEISEKLKKHRGDILLSVAAIATAESKWRAVGAAVKDVAITKMIGPLGIVLGSLKGVESVVKSILRDTGSLEAALQKLAKIQGLQTQFTGLLGSVEEAKRRVAELQRIAAGQKLFNLDELGRAGRELEVLTRGAYAGRGALQTIGDAAAASGNGLEAVASRVGQIHRDLRDGQSIRAAATELANMGVISQGAATHLATLQESGGNASGVFSALTAELSKAQGGMAAHAATVDGVTAAYDAARKTLAEKFGEPFEEAEIARMRDATTILTAFQKPVSDLAQWLNKVISPVEDLTVKFGAWLARIGALQPIIATAITGIRNLAVGLLVLGAGLSLKPLGAFLRGIFSIAVASNKAGTAMAALNTVMTAISATTQALAAGNMRLAAQQAVAGASALRTAAAFGTAAVASTVLKVAIRGLIAGTGIGLVIMALGWLGEKALNYFQSSSKAAKATKELASANREVESSLKRQIQEIRNLDDAQQTLIDTTLALIEARKKLAELQQSGASKSEIAEQKRTVAGLEQTKRTLERDMGTGRHGVSARKDEYLRAEAARERQVEDLTRQAAIERASGARKRLLMEQEQQRIAKEAEQGRITAAERVMLADKEAEMRSKNGGQNAAVFQMELAALRRKSPSAVIQAEQHLADMRQGWLGPLQKNFSPGQIQSEERRVALLRQRFEGDWEQKSQRAQQMRLVDIPAERKAQEMHDLELATELEIARLRTQGFEREEAAAKERIKAMEEQQKLLLKYGDMQGADALNPRIVAARQELRIAQERAALEKEMDASRLRVLELEGKATVAAARGRFAEADRYRREAIEEGDRMERRRSRAEKIAGNYTEQEADKLVSQEQAQREREREGRAALFRLAQREELRKGKLMLSNDPAAAAELQRMENDRRLRAKINEGFNNNLPAKEAVGLALQSMSQQIRLEQQQGPVVSGLGRIGGGGGAYDPGVDVQRQMKDLLERGNEYLRQIAARDPDTSRIPNEPNLNRPEF